MTTLFFIVLHMSLLAAVVALIALPLRWLFRFLQLPAWLCVALWLAVLIRMAAPAGLFTSSLSLMRWNPPAVEQRMETLSKQAAPSVVPPDLAPVSAGSSAPAAPGTQTVPASAAFPSVESRPDPAAVLAWVWGAGTLVLWAYAACSALRLRRRLRTAVRQGEGPTLRWESDRIPAPFVFGLFRPKIYVPVGLGGDALPWVLRHERAHLRLGHHWLKPLFFVALALHWFNPALWLAWVLFCRDLEVCCDECVLKHASGRQKDYSAALLSLAAPRQGLLLPPGFGETGVKDRIQRALRYRQPAGWMAAAAAVLAVTSICCFAADPAQPSRELPALAVQVDGKLWTLDGALEENAPWPETLPETQVSTDSAAPYIQVAFSKLSEKEQQALCQWDCTEYLVVDGQAQNPLARPCIGMNTEYYLPLDAREDAPGTGRETRLLVLRCTWETGTEPRTTEHAMLITLPSVQAAEAPAPEVPELNLETMQIRYPGDSGWTELGPLLPAPQEWAGQDWAGRSEAETLAGILFSGTGGFVDGTHGWFVCSVGHGVGGADTYVYRTRDGGRAWQETGRPDPAVMNWYPSCCCFVDDQIGVIAKSRFHGAEVFRTGDGGETWTQLELPLPSSEWWEAESISFRGADGLMVLFDGNGNRAALATHDGGVSWEQAELPESAGSADSWPEEFSER